MTAQYSPEKPLSGTDMFPKMGSEDYLRNLKFTAERFFSLQAGLIVILDGHVHLVKSDEIVDKTGIKRFKNETDNYGRN